MKNERYIKQLLDKWVTGSYKIADGVVNVKGNVFIRKWKEGRLPVQFGTVTEDFDCSSNQLVTLIGAPKVVGGVFVCSYNPLEFL